MLPPEGATLRCLPQCLLFPSGQPLYLVVGSGRFANPWTCFYYDYIVVAPCQHVEGLRHTVTSFLRLLGWVFAEEGSKASPFRESFEALGMEVDLSQSNSGRVFFTNTPKRVSELCETLGYFIEKGSLSQPLALRLRGRMQLADSQIFGRMSKLCLRAITKHAYGDASEALSAGALEAMVRFKTAVGNNIPRVLNAWRANPMFCFTDACYEPDAASWVSGIGGVLVDSSENLKAACSAPVTRSHRLVLGEGSSKTIIFECELAALLVAMFAWREALAHKPVVFFVDNNAARDICISARARSPRAEALLSVLLGLEESYQLQAWYARVPSPSKIADEPSRKPMKHLRLGGNLVAVASVNTCIDVVLRRAADKLGVDAQVPFHRAPVWVPA